MSVPPGEESQPLYFAFCASQKIPSEPRSIPEPSGAFVSTSPPENSNLEP